MNSFAQKCHWRTSSSLRGKQLLRRHASGLGMGYTMIYPCDYPVLSHVLANGPAKIINYIVSQTLVKLKIYDYIMKQLKSNIVFIIK